VHEAAAKERKLVYELNGLLAQVDQYEIGVANALWGEKSYPFRQEFIDTIARHHDTGGARMVDFKNAFEDGRREINGWAEEQTRGRIKGLIPAGGLDEFTRLVLTNAIYFKGEWSTPFKEGETKDRGFTLGGGTVKQVPTMSARSLNVARYAAFNGDGSLFETPKRVSTMAEPKPGTLYPGADGFAMVELPYKGGALSMVVIAPNDQQGLAALEAKLTPESLTGWIGKLEQRKTHVQLPKFKLETKYTLGDSEKPGALQEMGMVRAFVDPRDPERGAQFGGMTTSTDPMKQLYIAKVFHKAFVEVNEKGTEAAAATAVSMAVPLSMPMDRPFTPEFKAERPFLFLIRDTSSGTVLFLGRVSDPAG
jgi:serine protease inhibitor